MISGIQLPAAIGGDSHSIAATLGHDAPRPFPARLADWRRTWTLVRDNARAEKGFAPIDGDPFDFCLGLNLERETIAQLAVSKVVTFTSTYDHRIVQGAESGSFLARIEELLLGKDGFYEAVFRDLGVPHPPYRWSVDRNPLFGRREEIEKQARVLELINAYRVRGHLVADVDPLRMVPVPHHPELDLDTYGLTIWDLDREFWTGGLKDGEHLPLREIIRVMRRAYCGKVGTEYRFISNPEEKEWVRRRVGAVAQPPDPEVRRQILGPCRTENRDPGDAGVVLRLCGERRSHCTGHGSREKRPARDALGARRHGLGHCLSSCLGRGPREVMTDFSRMSSFYVQAR